MKTKLALYSALALISVVLLVFSGCYTRVATQDDDQAMYSQPGYGTDSSYAAGYDSTAGCCGDWDDYHRQAEMGFSYYCPDYYWPSVGFAAAFYSPWAFDPFWGYSPWYYPYPYAYHGYFGSAYYHPYGGYYSHGYGYAAYNGYWGGRRTIGTTRGGASPVGVTGRTETQRVDAQSVQADRGGYNLPTGGGYDRPATGSAARVQSSTHVPIQRPSGTSGNRSVTAWGSRGGAVRTGTTGGGSQTLPQGQKRVQGSSGQHQPRRVNSGGRSQSGPHYSAPSHGGGGRVGGGGGGRSGGGGGGRSGGGGGRGGRG